MNEVLANEGPIERGALKPTNSRTYRNQLYRRRGRRTRESRHGADSASGLYRRTAGDGRRQNLTSADSEAKNWGDPSLRNAAFRLHGYRCCRRFGDCDCIGLYDLRNLQAGLWRDNIHAKISAQKQGLITGLVMYVIAKEYLAQKIARSQIDEFTAASI
jgi:hypothetical protein